ncbi:MAG: sigma-54 dependent transcriptional regulator [candidate division KSB1 bacterium]|nr:sigma-54 dependent transcriptional regulator [candidate division KSB1 bacterium]
MKNNFKKSILIVEDDRLFRKAILNFLIEKYEVMEADNAEHALEMMKCHLPDLLIIDITLPGLDGIDFLEKIKVSYPEIPAIMLTAMDRIPKVVECIKMGAFDYLTKPIDAEELLLSIERALESVEIRKELEQRKRLQLLENEEIKLIGSSESMRKLKNEIKIVGETDATVLIQGETGTGKEVVARAIHAASPRAAGSFIAINCGAIPKELFESELFGHKRGAFTGADKDQIGKFQLAHRGTILLDEIGEIPLDVQAKLLRVIEEKSFYPLGSNELVRVDVRIIAATNRDLKKEVENGLFREDLYFRLNVYAIHIPPLRKRPEDIISLAMHFMELFNIKFGKKFKRISPEAKAILLQLPWTGNVRELRNTIERIILFESGTVIKKEHLYFIEKPHPEKKSKTMFELPEEGIDLEEVEKNFIKQALELAKYNKTKAARLLRLSPPTLYYRLQKYGFK